MYLTYQYNLMQVPLLYGFIAPHFDLHQTTYNIVIISLFICPLFFGSFIETLVINLFILDYLETPNAILYLEMIVVTFDKSISSLNKEKINIKLCGINLLFFSF